MSLGGHSTQCQTHYGRVDSNPREILPFIGIQSPWLSRGNPILDRDPSLWPPRIGSVPHQNSADCGRPRGLNDPEDPKARQLPG
jgi:hypothetical protein